MVGPPAKDGSSDTYFLADGADEFAPYPKRASEARLFSQTAAAYRGRLFAIAASRVEPEKRIFRATAIDTVEYPGDIPCETDEPVDPTKPDGPSAPTDQSQATVRPTSNTSPTVAKPAGRTQSASSTLPSTGDNTQSATTPFAAGIAVVLLSCLVRFHGDSRPHR